MAARICEHHATWRWKDLAEGSQHVCLVASALPYPRGQPMPHANHVAAFRNY